MEYIAKLIDVSGIVADIVPDDIEKGLSLEECYTHIGCELIEVIQLPKRMILIVDEEANYKSNQTVNVRASILSGRFILGNAIYCNNFLLK